MLLDDSYRLLDVDPRASDEELKRAHRDLTKVWHPDRFAHDASLRRKAEEKLKAINDAYDTIAEAREGATPDVASLARSQVRSYRTWATACSALAIFFLVRRPTPGGLVIAVVLLGAAVALILRTRGRVGG
jgi:hypothetical protein